MQSSEQPICYNQDPHFSLEQFRLNSESIVVSEEIMGLKKEKIFKLIEVCAEPKLSHQRFARFYVIPAILASICIGITWLLFCYVHVFKIVILFFPVILAIAFLWYAILGFKAVEVTTYSDINGSVVFRLYCPRNKSWEYKDFIKILQRNVEAVQRPPQVEGVSNKPMGPLGVM